MAAWPPGHPSGVVLGGRGCLPARQSLVEGTAMTDQEKRIPLSREDAAARIGDLQASVNHSMGELVTHMEIYQFPRLSVPQLAQAKRHLRLALEHLACAADLSVKPAKD